MKPRRIKTQAATFELNGFLEYFMCKMEKKIKIKVVLIGIIKKIIQSKEIEISASENIKDTKEQIINYIKRFVQSDLQLYILHNGKSIETSVKKDIKVKENDCFEVFPLISNKF